MDKTKHYNLSVTDNEETRVALWVQSMAGTQNSNMQIIDTVLSGKAEQSFLVEATLFADEWAEAENCFVQSLLVDGLTEKHNGNIGLSHNATSDIRSIAVSAAISVIGQQNGVLVVAADGEKPSVDIPVIVVVQD